MIKLQERAIRIGLIITGVLLPFDVNASGSIPAPEPVSLTLLAVGAAGLGAARRRRPACCCTRSR